MAIYLLLLALGVSLYLAGVHWTFQLIHFPLFKRVGVNMFQDYQSSHLRRAIYAVHAPGFIAVGLGLLMLLFRPWGLKPAFIYVFIAAEIVVSITNVVIFRPIQKGMSRQGYNGKMITDLNRLHWIRTVFSSVAALVLLYVVSEMLITHLQV